MNLITGLDIGTSQVKGVVVETKKDGSRAVVAAFKHPSEGLRKGVLIDTEEAARVFRNLAGELKEIGKEAPKNVIVNINSEHIKVRISRGISAVSQPDKEIRSDDIERAVQSSRAAKVSPNYKVLHTMVREFFVDEVGDIQNPIGMTGSRLEVTTLIIEAFAPHFDVLVDALEGAGLGIGGIIFNPFAAARAVLAKKQKELGVLLVDVGAGTTTLAVFEENKPLFAKSIPVGSNHITNDIAISLQVPVPVAERLKLRYGSVSAKHIARKEMIACSEFDSGSADSVSKKTLAEVIETRVAEMIEIINNELKPLKSRFQFPAGIVLTGGGSRIEGFPDFLKKGTGLPVQLGLPNLSQFEIVNPSHEALMDDPEFSVAVGLALIGHEDGKPRRGAFLETLKRALKNLAP